MAPRNGFYVPEKFLELVYFGVSIVKSKSHDHYLGGVIRVDGARSFCLK